MQGHTSNKHWLVRFMWQQQILIFIFNMKKIIKMLRWKKCQFCLFLKSSSTSFSFQTVCLWQIERQFIKRTKRYAETIIVFQSNLKMCCHYSFTKRLFHAQIIISHFLSYKDWNNHCFLLNLKVCCHFLCISLFSIVQCIIYVIDWLQNPM